MSFIKAIFPKNETRFEIFKRTIASNWRDFSHRFSGNFVFISLSLIKLPQKRRILIHFCCSSPSRYNYYERIKVYLYFIDFNQCPIFLGTSISRIIILFFGNDKFFFGNQRSYFKNNYSFLWK